MIKEIKYTGFTATPSDYECPDGELDAAINLVPEEGELHPVQAGEALLQLPNEEGGVVYKVLFVHKTSTYRHVIIVKETHGSGSTYSSQLYWLNVSNAGSLSDALKNADASTKTAISHVYTCANGKSLSVSAIGNTLIVTGDTSDSMHYVLWKDNAYQYLGNHLPEIFLSFSLRGQRVYKAPQGSYAVDDMPTLIDPSRHGMSYYGQIISHAARKISDSVMGYVVSSAKSLQDGGSFIYPFFVRYALRLYDGTITMHSAPILMNPCTTCNPFVYASSASEDAVNIVAMFVAADLEAQLLNAISDTTNLADWEDIITGVDIFVTNQLCPFDQDGNIESVAQTAITGAGQSGRTGTARASTDIANSVFIGSFGGTNYAQYKFPHIYGTSPRAADYRDGAAEYQADMTEGGWPKYNFVLPELKDEQMKNSLESESRFYFLQSIPLDELSSYTTRKKIEFPVTRIDTSTGTGRRTPAEYESALTSLLGHEIMTDDYHSHDKIAPNSVFDYNGRLNMAGIRRTLFNGFPLSSMLAYCNKRYDYSGGTFYYKDAYDKYSIEVYIKINGEDKKVVCNLDENGLNLQNYLSDYLLVDDEPEYQPDSWGIYLFYPDRNAYKMRIIHRGVDSETSEGRAYHAEGEYYDVVLKPHDFMNGAYAYLDFNVVRLKTGDTTISNTTSVTIDELSKIYTSDASNPFIFSTTNINTVGTGEILRVATATKALSQGQFGQFPLYAFTTEGVWALEVASDGTFSSKHPVTRDVCTNADSITQLDNSVIFSTDRGIMLLSGSDTICITDSIFSDSEFKLITPSLTDVVDLLPHLDRLLNARDTSNNLLYPSVTTASGIVPFKKFLPAARMLYDYVHQRIIVYNPDKGYAYIYSLKSKRWGMMESNIMYGINSYPECLAVDGAKKIVNLSAVPEPAAGQAIPSVNGLVITRPLKLDAPDILKTIDTIIQRGQFRKGSVQTILYGSRDLFHWHLVYSSNDHYLRGFRGTPYKYFRIVLLCELQKDESIFGCTIQFNPRLLDQPR